MRTAGAGRRNQTALRVAERDGQRAVDPVGLGPVERLECEIVGRADLGRGHIHDTYTPRWPPRFRLVER
jgi:hypothetical protein